MNSTIHAENKKTSITIGIPTYNRPAALAVLLKKIAQTNIQKHHLKVLVIDDGSDAEEAKTLSLISENTYLKNSFCYLRNEINLGYPKTFIRLFNECKTDYLMIVTDDGDIFLEEGFQDALKFLSTIPADLLSPQCMFGQKIYRGIKKTRPITIEEFISCSNHAPGLIYNVDEARKHLNKLKDRLEQKCAFTFTYPQTVLCLHLLLAKRTCYWLNSATAGGGEGLPSGIKDPMGSGYWTYGSRLRQAASIDDLLNSLEVSEDRDAAIKIARLAYINWIYRTTDDETREAFKSLFTIKKQFRAAIGKCLPPRLKTFIKYFCN